MSTTLDQGPSPLPPGSADPRPGWPAWYAPLGFVVALATALLVIGTGTAIAAAAGLDVDDGSPVATLVGTLLQDGIFVGAAVLFASFIARPRAWHFGLRRTRLGPAVGWTVLAILCFYVLAAAYSVLVEPEGEQSVIEDLGAEDSTAMLVASAVLIVGIAPVAEEIFFRGFFYGSLRSRFGVAAAATISAGLFGVIHYTGPDTLALLPVLAMLGLAFCLLYEVTGSLYPPIAFHALNNAIAFSVQLEDSVASGVAAGVAAVLIVSCVAIGGASQRTPSPLRDP